ncbi:MAG: alkaline phosphatase D family protein [Phycisphaerales bacterium]|nr:alkaline phosphatase D family protein [Phycisphaerales bacterium]
MILLRRRRCSMGALLAAVALLGGCGRQEEGPLELQVAAGDVDATTAVLWARASTSGEVRFEYSTDATFAADVVSATKRVAFTPQPVKLEINDLLPGAEYHYRAMDERDAMATGRFRTAHEPGDFHGLRFGVSGDWRGDLGPYPSVRNAPQRDLDFFVALGDTIYADYESPALIGVPQAQNLAQFRAKHNEVYTEKLGLNTLADLRAATAIYAVIDDHEVTNDFSGGAAPWTHPLFGFEGKFINETELFLDGVRVFQEFHPLRNESYGDTGDSRTSGKVKMYRTRTFGQDAAMILLDTRTFRDQSLEGTVDLEDPLSTSYFLLRSLEKDRTLLGAAQLADFKADLLDAHERGLTWKFILIPEPIQNLGPILSFDRYEGYAQERADVLEFISVHDIRNVVFIAADIHGTIVNNLTYTREVLGAQIPVDAWEITTGAVAFDPCLGSVVVDEAVKMGLIQQEVRVYYDALPRDLKDAALIDVLNGLLALFGYDSVGLEGSSIPATLVSGRYYSFNTFGWTEFNIDPGTQQLRVTTYGIDAYRRDILNPGAQPEVVSEFTVDPT